MSIFDKQRITAVSTLEALGYAFVPNKWLAPADRVVSMVREADQMHALLVQRADQLGGCTENSPEEREVKAIAEKSLASFNRRLDRIEERFGEALSQVAQRSDLDGLRLIEAQVLELAAQVEETRGRLDRIDAIGDNVSALANRLDEGGNQRFEVLEKLLQDYVAEWRRGERTTSTLRTLEDAVGRIGDAVDALEPDESKRWPEGKVPGGKG